MTKCIVKGTKSKIEYHSQTASKLHHNLLMHVAITRMAYTEAVRFYAGTTPRQQTPGEVSNYMPGC